MNVPAVVGGRAAPAAVANADRQDTRHLRSVALVAARWAVALVLLGIVLWQVDLAEVSARLGAADLALAALAVAGLVAVQLIPALAWRRLLRDVGGLEIGVRPSIALSYAGQAIGFLTPGNVGADVYRFAAIAGSGRRAAATPILVQRVTSTVGLGVLALVGASVLPSATWASPPVAVAVVTLLVLGLGAAVVLWLIRRRPASALRATVAVVGSSADPRRAWRSVIVDGLGLGLAFHVVSLGLGLLAVAAIDPGTATHPGPVLAALALARLWLLIPVSPSGLGVQEGALALLFSQLALPPDVAIAALVLNRLALLIGVGIGAVAIGRRSSGRRMPPTAG